MRWDLLGTLIAGIVLGALVVGHSFSQTPGGWQLRACGSASCAWRLQASTGHLECCQPSGGNSGVCNVMPDPQ